MSPKTSERPHTEVGDARGSMLADVSTAAGREQRDRESASNASPALTILSHPLARRAGEQLLLRALAAGREVALSRNEPDFVKPGAAVGRPLDDPFVSRKPVRFASGREGGVRIIAGDGTKLTAGEPIQGGREIAPGELARGVALELAGRVALLLHVASTDQDRAASELGMVGRSDGIRQVRADVERVVDLSVPVLIRGETGTGKELVARAVHERGPRRSGPFVSVNLGAIPRELAAAELFGARRGAYTGATRDREGFFRAAAGGTLFLDEIGEAPPEVQAMLLRVLETGEMYPVGGESPVATDVRLVAATDADLEEHIRQGRFKAPLLHRLSGYEIRLPALRERPEDIGMLFYHFAQKELEAIGEAHRLAPEDPYAEPWLPPDVAAWLVRHSWPGNIRQLRNVTRQLVIGSRGRPRLEVPLRLWRELTPADAPPSPRAVTPISAEESGVRARRKTSEVTEAELLAALRACAWDFRSAAARLGIPRSSIYDLIERCPGIRTAGDLGAKEILDCHEACGGDLDAMAQKLEVSGRALKRRLKELGVGVRRG